MSMKYGRMDYFRSLDLEIKTAVLKKLLPRQQRVILSELTEDEILALLQYVDPDTAADFLQALDSLEKQEAVLEKLNETVKEKITFLLRFKPESAGGIMDVNYIQVIPKSTFKEVAEQMQRHYERTGRMPTIIVYGENKVYGEIPPQVLALYDKRTPIDKHVVSVPTIEYDAPTDKVIRRFLSNKHTKVVVLDDDGVILGIIYSDDIAPLLEKQKTKGLYDFAGVSGQEDIFDSVEAKVRNRYKWLIINLGTAFMAASVIGMFSDTISKFVLLASYMPIIAGMGGNAATQTLAVMVRAISLDEIELSNCWTALRNEAGAGIINGAINGVIVAIIAIIFNHSPKLGLVTGLALIINLFVAGFFGAIIPLILKKLGKDPATSATVFITTATDVLGFMSFLTLAKLIL